MKLAVIDCGTNTFNLLILDIKNLKVQSKLLSTRQSVKLGQGSINNGFISQPAMNRALEAIGEFNKHIKKLKVDKIIAYATSAVREAANGHEFIDQVNKKYQISIQVIDGLTEANLIYEGVKNAVSLNKNVSLIMDIGGGSVEFILAQNHEIIWKESFKIGAARILEIFKPSNPIKQKEIKAINQYFKNKLQNLFDAVKLYRPKELIGSSGAFESFMELLAEQQLCEPLCDSKTEYNINTQHYFTMADALIKSSAEERTNMKGLVPMRVDMIVISCLMVNFILNQFKLNQMRVSTYALKEGALYNFLNNNNF